MCSRTDDKVGVTDGQSLRCLAYRYSSYHAMVVCPLPPGTRWRRLQTALFKVQPERWGGDSIPEMFESMLGLANVAEAAVFSFISHARATWLE
ncbi:hypothetical protein R1flu_005944 [Riccia fluitans]|uniref:Uncharacterized protein n=1 Tax=Riccia fluitans TaxID=41844 RepID=A0ABD1YVF1_9MARC